MRHRAHSPAYARLSVAQADATDLSEILDISEDGMSVQTSSPLEVERHMSLSLDLSETSASIFTTGQVVWSESSGRAGIRFARLSEQSLDRLKEWLFANVLTAFDHAGANPADEDRWKYVSKVLPLSHIIPKGEFTSGARLIAANDSSTTQPEAATGAGALDFDETRNRYARERATERESELEPKRFDPEAELQSIAERALTLTRATGAAIALSADTDQEMICVASAGDDAPPVRSRLQVGSGFSGECVRTGRSLRCDDSETDDRVDRAGCKSLGIRSLVAVPIRQGSKVAGLLEVFSPQPYAFNPDDIGALQQLTGSILTTVQPEKARPAKVQVSSPIQAPPPPVRSPRTEKSPAPKAANVDTTVETERRVTAAKPSTEPSSIKPAAAPARAAEPRSAPVPGQPSPVSPKLFLWPPSALLCLRFYG